MRAAEMNDITLSDVHVNEIRCGQALRSLVDENPSPVLPFCVLPECVRLININFNQGVAPSPLRLDVSVLKGRHTFLVPIRHVDAQGQMSREGE